MENIKKAAKKGQLPILFHFVKQESRENNLELGGEIKLPYSPFNSNRLKRSYSGRALINRL